MFSSKMKISFSQFKVCSSESFVKSQFAYYYNRKIDTVAKRGSMLENLFKNKDKRKNWAFNIQSTKPKIRIFDGVHKPHRRRAVLNTLFIRNITDVLSTEEIVPELFNFGIEITGVQVSPCFKIVNVFWQLPESKFHCVEEVGKLLTVAAPRVRAELISRNVLGRVPFIYFLRDSTNAKIAEYEQAMKKIDLEPKTDPFLVIDDSFTKDIMSFKSPKEVNTEQIEPVKNVVEEIPAIPFNPPDMKCDVFGLDHNTLMNKVIASRKKKLNAPEKSAVIDPSALNNEDDLFSKIPGVCFRSETSKNSESREALLKKFQIERKMLKEKFKTRYVAERCEYQGNEDYDTESNFFEDDFVEEEIKDNQ